MLRVGVKYCGGCNPEYDRVALVEQIEKRSGEKIDFTPYGNGKVDLILAVHGCKTACADMSGFEGTEIWNITDIKDAEKFIGEVVNSGTGILPVSR